jgi:hypothetical protein
MSDKMVEKVTQKLTKLVSRRGILAGLSAGAAALASSLLGTAKASAALYNVVCCHLCKPNDLSCGDIGNSCSCSWAWYCTYYGCYRYMCFECYSAGYPCGPTCHTGIKCSKVVFMGKVC